jgi:hypothetical protein
MQLNTVLGEEMELYTKVGRVFPSVYERLLATSQVGGSRMEFGTDSWDNAQTDQ